MSKRFKAQASSARAADPVSRTAAFGGFGSQPLFQSASSLSYVAEQPDLSSVSDPNVVVSLRNLSKKDSTTKAKAVEELLEHVKSRPQVEDGVIVAWIALYPRISIDNARRVRQLAHTLQGSLTAATTKRILPYLNKVIGPWLSGLFDNDRAVARCAQDALRQSFPRPENQMVLWKRYRHDLIEYAKDAILVQSAATLSDERSTSKDDAEAKYTRVVSAAMLMLARLLAETAHDEKTRVDLTADMAGFLTEKKLWEYVYNPTPALRVSCCNLVLLCAKYFHSILDWSTISSCFVAKGLNVNHLGSSTVYVNTLLLLTGKHRHIWTDDYHSKTPALKRLLQFICRGSQRGREAFWFDLEILIKQVPSEIIWSNTHDASVEDAVAVAGAFYQGISSQDEPRQNLTAASRSYVGTCFWLAQQLSNQQLQEEFLRLHPTPLIIAYINPESATGNLPSISGLQIASSILQWLLEMKLYDLFSHIWSAAAESLVERMKLSQPESSKDFKTSQDAVVASSTRLLRLRQEIQKHSNAEQLPWLTASFEKAQTRLTDQAVELLRNRNGKPYGAAAVLQDSSNKDKQPDSLVNFFGQDMSIMLESPSAEILISLWQASGKDVGPWIKYLMGRPNLNTYGQRAFEKLLASATIEDLEAVPIVKQIQAQPLERSVDPQQHNNIIALLANPAIKSSTLRLPLVDSLLKDLSLDLPVDDLQSTLDLLESSMKNDTAKAALTEGESGNDLHAKLLLLAGSDDSLISERASTVLKSLRPSEGDANGQSRSKTLIRNQLAGATPQLPILSVLDLAVTELDQLLTGEERKRAIIELLPSDDDWEVALKPFANSAVPVALSITSPLQGAIYLARPTHTSPLSINVDADGFSQLYRLAFYTSKLLYREKNLRDVAREVVMSLVRTRLLHALQYLNDKVTMNSANEMWTSSAPEDLSEAADLLSEGRELVSLLDVDGGEPDEAVTALFEHGDGYVSTLVAIDRISRIVDREGSARVFAEWEARAKDLESPPIHRSSSLMYAAAVVFCFKEPLMSSRSGGRILNELISDATQMKPFDLSMNSSRPLVLLNILLADDQGPLDAVPSQRLVFLMQNLLKSLQDFPTDWLVVSEILKLLTLILPFLQDIYGDYWRQMLNYLCHVWDQDLSGENELPVLHSSLRLYSRLRGLAATEDVNEDLQEAWQALTSKLEEGLLKCLELLNQPSVGVNQPRSITASLLGRLLADVHIKEVVPLYQFMSSKEDSILDAIYNLLHETIPQQQEDLSLDLVLEKQVMKLPSELLGLLADLPEMHGSPRSLKTYFLCWQLALDHFERASYKLREAYLASLKEANSLPGLLDRICDAIRIIESRPVDASKFTIDNFTLGTSDTESKELQWLAINLYYRSLLHVPSLVKAWFIEQKNRVRTPLETWTQRYLSPSIVAASFDNVTEWAKAQDQGDDAVGVKASPKAFELTASMAIDPESPAIAIAIVLPSSYPLNPPSVLSRTRVAVSEKKWESWLRTIQIIIFSTGSIIEGLIAFRRNVQGAIKGQGECAICYSIIGTDMQTPNKKCGTCKNTFHGVCLFRWFKSSNSSSCPLCRNNFNYA